MADFTNDFLGSETNSGDSFTANPIAAQDVYSAAASNGNNGNGNGNNAKGHVCTDPDEHGPQGNGNGYGHNKDAIDAQSLSPDGTADYGGKVGRDILSTINVSYGWMYEGGTSSKHTGNEYDPSVDISDTSPLGIPIKIWLEPAEGATYNDAYFDYISFVPDIPGTFYMGDGTELTDGLIFNDQYGNQYEVEITRRGEFTLYVDAGSEWMPVDLSAIEGLYFVPEDPYVDQDFRLEYDVHVKNDKRGKAAKLENPYVVIDAVADKPDYIDGAETDVVVGASGDTLAPSDIKFEDGKTIHTIGGGIGASGEPVGFTLGNIQFYDYEDESEEAFILIRAEDVANWKIDIDALGSGEHEAFEKPAGNKFDTIWLDDGNHPVTDGTPGAQAYIKVVVSNQYIYDNDGLVNLKLPVIIGSGTKNDDYDFDIKVGTRELVTPDDGNEENDEINKEIDFGNNFSAINVHPVQVKVQAVATQVTISSGWAYESGAKAQGDDNLEANPDATGQGDGYHQFDYISASGKLPASAAVININPVLGQGETLGSHIELTYDGSRGAFYDKNGVRISAKDDSGFLTIATSKLLSGDYPVYFVPAKDCADDSDISIHYEFSINVPDGSEGIKKFKAEGDIPIVVDAVADSAKMNIAPSGDTPEFQGFVLDYNAKISTDDSEQQFIVIKNPGGLLALKEGGEWEKYLEVVKDVSALQDFDSQDEGSKKYFDDIESPNIVLRVKDLSGFPTVSEGAHVKATINLPFTITDRGTAGDCIDVTIQTIVVEHEGNNKANWTGDQEYDFANNIALTEDTATVHLATGEGSINVSSIYEGDNRLQNLRDEDRHEDHGTAINIDFNDSHEAINEIAFTLSVPGGGNVDGAIVFNYQGSSITLAAGESLRFISENSGMQALYSGISKIDKNGDVTDTITFDSPATLEAINSSLSGNDGLRFIPSGDSDADVTVSISGSVTDTRSGDLLENVSFGSITIVRDAVADLPTGVAANVDLPNGGYEAAQAGATVTLNIRAAFGDYKDDSESHYLFISKEYLESLKIPDGFTDDFTVLGDNAPVFAQVLGDNGIKDADASRYFVVQVTNSYLKNNGGNIALPLEATLRNDDSMLKDGSADISFMAVAVEHDGLKPDTLITGDNSEVRTDNNVAVAEGKAPIRWATLEKDFSFTPAGPVYEDDRPGQNTSDKPSPDNGTTIAITAKDPSEVIVSLKISYAHEDNSEAAGKIWLEAGAGSPMEIASGSTLDFEYSENDPTLCVKVTVTDENGSSQSLDISGGMTLEQLSQGLRYVPHNDTHSDKDVIVKFEGVARETKSGEEGKFVPDDVRIVVDAVADLPDGKPTGYEYTQYGKDIMGRDHTAIQAGDAVSFNVATKFTDLDGSENHYLLIDTKYLANGIEDILLNDPDDPTVPAVPFNDVTLLTDPTERAAFFDKIKGDSGFEPRNPDDYAILDLDPTWLQANGGVVSLTIKGTLLDAAAFIGLGAGHEAKTDLEFEVKAVAVEYDGENTGKELPNGDKEPVNTNNVAVADLDVTFQWDAFANQFELKPGIAFEGDQVGQIKGDYDTFAGGAALAITPSDVSETITKIRVEYSGDNGKVVIVTNDGDIDLASGAEVTFLFGDADRTLITGVLFDDQTYSVKPQTIAALTASSLTYRPNKGNDDDSDVEVTITAQTLDTLIGTTSEVTLVETVVVDAVADRPLDVDAQLKVTHGKGDTVIFNDSADARQDSFEINLTARFGDFKDGSESHYVFISKTYLASIDGLPDGLGEYQGNTALLLANAGLSDDYFVLQVSHKHLDANGLFAGKVTAHLNGASLPEEGTPFDIGIKFAAIEYDGKGTMSQPVQGSKNKEADAENNVALENATVTLKYAKLDKDFGPEESSAFEGDAPNQHIGNFAATEEGAAIDFYPKDASEAFSEFTVTYAGEGSLQLAIPGTGSVDIASGSKLEFGYAGKRDGAPLCTSITITDKDNAQTRYDLDSRMTLQELMGAGNLAYIPDKDSQSDADVTISFTGKYIETVTDEEGSFIHNVVVKVDAVADMPDTSPTIITNPNAGKGESALDPTEPFDLDINVNFGKDIKDGSETHYLFVSKEFLASLKMDKAPAGVTLLDDDGQASIICNYVKGDGGIENASPHNYFVLQVDAGALDKDGNLNLAIQGKLDAQKLKDSKLDENSPFTLDIKAVAIEHQGFRTPIETNLGQSHGLETDSGNNVAVKDASALFTFASAKGDLKDVLNKAYEGDQPDQHIGVKTTAGGGSVVIAPAEDSEVFTQLTLDYSAKHGKLIFADVNGDTVEIDSGAELVFSYHADNLTECVGVEVRQGSHAPVILSFADNAGNGKSLEQLTGKYLRYIPEEGNNDDVDVQITLNGIVRETKSGALGKIEDAKVIVVVDAVADQPFDLSASGSVVDSVNGDHKAAKPGDTFTINLNASFDDYKDGSEAHYIFIEKTHVNDPQSVTGGSLVTGKTDLDNIFKSLAVAGGTGIHAGSTAAQNYHVVKVDDDYLAGVNGNAQVSLTSKAGNIGEHNIVYYAVAIEHEGYATKVGGIDGGTDKDVTQKNNVAEEKGEFTLTVREFAPEKVEVKIEEWAFENDRSRGDLKYHDKNDNSDRDGGVPLNITPPADGNVISLISFEYDMPSNGSSMPHSIVSMTPEAVTINQHEDKINGKVYVTIEAKDPYGNVGQLRFIPGDNYDNDDVDITITQIHVADPLLHTTSRDIADWGTGVAEGSNKLHVRVDAVAQAPGLGDFDVDHDSGNPVKAGEIIHITGEVSFEDTADGSEEHFILLEMQDGYYPDEVTLKFNGKIVTIPVIHYQPNQPANYTMQQLVTADDGQPHMFMKIPVDSYLLELAGGNPDNLPERMDDIKMDVAYQTRDWAAEGTALHFAAIANEDVEGVREYDANWNIINDELPFDKQLLKYVPDLKIMDNNTAITIAAQGAYVYWDEYDSDLLNFKGYVFENDRPSDHLRNPAYILDLPDPAEDIVQTYPVDPFLQPYDPVKFTGRDFGTGYQLNIPQNIHEFTITEHTPDNKGKGDFYYLPASVWSSHMSSPGPDSDAAIAGYKVSGTVAGQEGYILVFIPSNEAYRDYHQENDTSGENSHSDHDYHFDYEFVTNEYSPSGAFRGHKHYYGENKVIRIDAVANQAELISAETGVAEEFSLWNLKDTVSEFDLTVGFHDVDKTEDHYILVEMVPNFAFRCGSYYYRPRGGGNVSPTDTDAIYTHVHTDENGGQHFIRYYKVPVNLADIDPVTGNATVHVEFLRLPGMPSVADYPSSDLLTYGALTEDKTCSRWDSTDPTADNFVNRKGADGELSYDNNTSVIIRNGIGNGADDSGLNPGWWEPGTIPSHDPDDPNYVDPDLPLDNPVIIWPNGPNRPIIPVLKPYLVNPDIPWYPTINPDEPNPWTPQPVDPDNPQPGWVLPGIPDAPTVPRPNPDNPDNPDPWIATRGQGLAIQWVFENSTPLGHLEAGQYADGIWPTSIYLTDDRPNDAAYVKITIPGIDDRMIQSNQGSLYYIDIPWVLGAGEINHSRALLGLIGDTSGCLLTYESGPGSNVTYILQTPGGQLPDNVHLLMFVAPDSKGEDFQMEVTWYDANDNVLSSGPVDVLVDAVAQWANFDLENEDGVYGVTGETPSQLVGVDVNVGFLDQDGSESNYVLVEKIPGVLVLHKGEDGNFDEVKEVYLEGKTYFRIEPTKDEQKANLVHLEFSVNEELTSPMYVRDDIVYKGMTFTGMHIDMGTMTVEGQTGWEASGTEPANWEYTLKNNTSLNLKEDALTIVISKVNAKGGNSAIFAEETDAPEQHIIYLDPNDPDNGLNLVMDSNDVLDSLVVTSIGGNGKFWIDDGDGSRIEIVQGMDIAQAYLAGKVFHEQERYRDDDATLEWTADLHDGLSPDSNVTINGTLTVVVDAVAKASEISLGYPVLDDVNHTLTQELTFADFANNEQHYAVIAPDLYRVVDKQAKVLDGNGDWQTVNVETIFSPDGDPYYAVLLDGYLDNNGMAKVQFTMHELNVPGIENYPVISGGVSIEPNSGFFASDREPVLTNNWAINTDAKFVHEGSISSADLVLEIDSITENDADGSPVSFSGTLGDNDRITAARLEFSATGGIGDKGEQIATVIYNGLYYAVIADASGNAVTDIGFGNGGFDPNSDFRIVWGKPQHDVNGNVTGFDFNHNVEGKLNFSTTFTVKNTVSGAEARVPAADPDGVNMLAKADPAGNISAQVTQINGNAATGTDPIGAGADNVTVALGGHFEDVDGSEAHYLMIELQPGWTPVSGNGDIHVHAGVNYYRVLVNGTATDPVAEITLQAPKGVSSDVTLKTASMSEEASGDRQYSSGSDIVLKISDVGATGLDLSQASMMENGLLSLDIFTAANLKGDDGNDILNSVTFTDLKKGHLVDGNGDLIAGHTLTAAQLASGNVFYQPKANYAGELDDLGRPRPVILEYSAEFGDDGSGATTMVTGQTLKLDITPQANAPTTVAGTSNNAVITADLVGAYHKAVISVTLDASFEDIDGSESHFFIVRMPKGVVVLAGADYTVESPTKTEQDYLESQQRASADSGQIFKLILDNNREAQPSITVNLEVRTNVYTGGSLAVIGGASEQKTDGTIDYGFTSPQDVALPPAVSASMGNNSPVPEESIVTLDSLRQTMASGNLKLDGIDLDEDDVTVTGVANGAWDKDDNGVPAFIAKGVYGTLYVHEDGAYHYVLEPGVKNVSQDEVFAYKVGDGFGGEGHNNIVIRLTNPNTAPASQDVSATLDSVRGAGILTDILKISDGENDAFEVASVNGSVNKVNLGTDADPLFGFKVQGDYGTLRVFEDSSGKWRYEYILDQKHRGEERNESFTFTVKDEFGEENPVDYAIDIDLYNGNQAPVADVASGNLDTLRNTAVEADINIRDPEGDSISLASASSAKGIGHWDTDESGARAFMVQGEHGTLYLYENVNGKSLHYRYVLTDASTGGFQETETFSYTVDDGYLGQDTKTITINLDNPNRAPVINGTLNPKIDVLRANNGQISDALSFSDPDFNGDQNRHDSVSLAGVAFGGRTGVEDGNGGFIVAGDYGVFHIDAAGSYSYTLNNMDASLRGNAESFTITVADEFGKFNRETVVIDLVLHNQDPIASTGNSTLDTWRGGGVVSGKVDFTDADDDIVLVDSVIGAADGVEGFDPSGNPAFVVAGEFGSLYLQKNGNYIYVLNPNFVGKDGVDSFVYTVDDGHTGSDSNTITINLDNANAAPVITGKLSDKISGAYEDYPDGIVSRSGVFSWADPDGDLISSFDVSSVNIAGVDLPASGETIVEGLYGNLVIRTDGSQTAQWTYTLKPGEHAQGRDGVESFGFVISDIYNGVNSTSKLEIELKPLTHKPVCEDLFLDWGTTESGKPLSSMEGQLVFSDYDIQYDPVETLQLYVNGKAITKEMQVEGKYGVLTIDPKGQFSYSYDLEDQASKDVREDFDIQVVDSKHFSDSATLSIRLTDNAPPFPGQSAVQSVMTLVDADVNDEDYSAMAKTRSHAVVDEDDQSDLPVSDDFVELKSTSYDQSSEQPGKTGENELQDSGAAENSPSEEETLKDKEEQEASIGQGDAFEIASTSKTSENGDAEGQPYTSGSVPAPETSEAYEPMPEPDDIELASVPLPYDPADAGSVIA